VYKVIAYTHTFSVQLK